MVVMVKFPLKDTITQKHASHFLLNCVENMSPVEKIIVQHTAHAACILSVGDGCWDTSPFEWRMTEQQFIFEESDCKQFT